MKRRPQIIAHGMVTAEGEPGRRVRREERKEDSTRVLSTMFLFGQLGVKITVAECISIQTERIKAEVIALRG